MALFKCKMCGGELPITLGNPIAKCEYCGTSQTVPSTDNEKMLTLFARANRLRASCEFDKAFGVYEAIVADFPEEAEAYWGLVLCKYGIEYVDDPATGKKIPTCHRSSFESVMEDSDFEQACENADAMARRMYREEAKQIEELRKGIVAVSNNEQPYDIFICYKETDAKGDRTLDSVLAQDVYDALTQKGYRVFFSRISLEDKLGVEYEPYIFAALNSAKVMLVFGTDYEYFDAVWVKNEWGRFLKLMAKDKEKHLIPCYKGIDAYDMPKEFMRLQAQDLGKVGAIQDLLRNMDKLLSKDGASVRQTPVSSALDENVSQLLSNAYAAMENKEWEKADGLLAAAENAKMTTTERVLVEQSIRQNREKAQFQMRCEKTCKENQPKIRILVGAGVLAFLIGFVFMSQCIFNGYNEFMIFGYFMHICCTVPFCMMAVKAMKFVPKLPGGYSAWAAASYILCGLGILISALFIIGINPDVDQRNYLAMQAICRWFGTMACLYGAIIVSLLFRKKV